jgi:hypothetical protein
VPIVFVSASEVDARTPAADVGEHLAKPFRAAELIACVERSLRR